MLRRIEAGQFKRPPKARMRVASRKGKWLERVSHVRRVEHESASPLASMDQLNGRNFAEELLACASMREHLTIANNLCSDSRKTSCKCLLTEGTSPLYSLLGK